MGSETAGGFSRSRWPDHDRTAESVGVSRQQMTRMATARIIERLRQGLYLVDQASSDLHRELRSVWLLLDPARFAWDRLDDEVPTGVVSHRSAAHLHNLGDLDADVSELTTVRRVRLRFPNVRLRTAPLTREDWTVVNDLPVTTPLRTVADLASEGTDSGHLAGVLRDAVVGEKVTLAEAEESLGPFAASYGHQPGDGLGFATNLIEIAGVPRSSTELTQIAANAQRKDISVELEKLNKNVSKLSTLAMEPLEHTSGFQRTSRTIDPEILNDIGKNIRRLRNVLVHSTPQLDPATTQHLQELVKRLEEFDIQRMRQEATHLTRGAQEDL